MAVAIFMKWDGVTAERYDEVRRLVNWEGDVPPGGMLHMAAFDNDGMRVTDVWESAEAFQTFVDGRLTPGVQQLGITTQPDVQILPVHALFTPAFKPI
ncbi:MAG TPA: hypothetical protein VNL92_00305 [Dehalococcoidia bacterium]|nr:hypothetical protein [Dehalococcoidia bacterium]